MKSKIYQLQKEKREGIITLNNSKLDGFRISPQNKIEYPGIQVKSLLIIKPSLIDKLLKKKNKKKLDYYLQYIISLIDGEDSDEGSLRQALNDLTRYREIVEFKYRKYMDDKYINLLLKKIALLEHEIKSRMIYKEQVKYYQSNKKRSLHSETKEHVEKGKSR